MIFVNMLSSAVRLHMRRLPTQLLSQGRRSSLRRYTRTDSQAARVHLTSTLASVAFASFVGWVFYHSSTGVERTESMQESKDPETEMKDSLDWRFKSMLPYLVETASAALRLNELDGLGKIDSGVRHVYGVRHSSINPIEDQWASSSIKLFHGGWWSFWGIYDGHS